MVKCFQHTKCVRFYSMFGKKQKLLINYPNIIGLLGPLNHPGPLVIHHVPIKPVAHVRSWSDISRPNWKLQHNAGRSPARRIDGITAVSAWPVMYVNRCLAVTKPVDIWLSGRDCSDQCGLLKYNRPFVRSPHIASRAEAHTCCYIHFNCYDMHG